MTNSPYESPAAGNSQAHGSLWNRLGGKALLERCGVGLALAAAFVGVTAMLWFACALIVVEIPAIDHDLDRTILALFPAVAAATFVFLRLGGGHAPAAIGLPVGRPAAKQFALGMALSVGLALAATAVLWTAGLVEIRWGAEQREVFWRTSLPAGAAMLAIGAAGEELLFRGYGFQQLMRATNPWFAVGAASIAFGFMHDDNPDFSSVALLNTVLFGALFGLALVRHRTLWLPYGLHLGWNIALPTFGSNLSGLRIRLTELYLTPAGPELWTGGSYGLEASLLVTAGIVGLGGVLCLLPAGGGGEPRLWELP